MARYFSSITRLLLPVVLACFALAIAIRILPVSPSISAWAAIRNSEATRYSNVIVVARSGGDFTSVQKALNNITDSSPTNRYLVWVAPGIYTETVSMKQYVDIEGAGELVTKIASPGGPSPDYGTVTGANNAELRSLTVENTGGNRFATAIYISSTSPRLLHVTATASGGTETNYGFYINNLSAPALTNVTAIASTATSAGVSNYGISAVNASPMLTDSVISAVSGTYNYGMWAFGSSATVWNSKLSATGPGTNYALATSTYHGNYLLTVDNSTLVGSTNTIINTCCGAYPMRVGASKLEGGPVLVTNGTITCAGVYDENYAFYPSSCP